MIPHNLDVSWFTSLPRQGYLICVQVVWFICPFFFFFFCFHVIWCWNKYSRKYILTHWSSYFHRIDFLRKDFWAASVHMLHVAVFKITVICTPFSADEHTRFPLLSRLNNFPNLNSNPGFTSSSCVIWDKSLNIPRPQFLVCKKGRRRIPTSWNGCEDGMC